MRIGKLAMVLLAVAAFSCGVWAADAYTPRTGAFDAGYYAIFSASSGLALTVDHETCTEDGAGIFLWEYEGFACQEWQILEYGEGIYSVVNRQSGKALTLDWYSIFEAGSGIVQWYDLGYPNQLWRFRIFDEASYLLQSAESELCLGAVEIYPDPFPRPHRRIRQMEFTGEDNQIWVLRLVTDRP